MRTFTWLPLLVAIGLFYAQIGASVGSNQAPEQQEGVEVQARGPVHEAFAEPIMRRQGQSPVVTKKPPAPVKELPAEQKPDSADVVWIPGYFAWDDDRKDFLWVSGIWRIPPPGRHWVPGYWQQQDTGWVWVSGYWGAQGATAVELLPPPPDSIAEAEAPAPDANSTFVPGSWVYQQDQYWWRPGHWITLRPGWIWNTPGYLWTPGGYVFVDGYWDHDLARRGMLFAPVFLDPRFYTRPNWVYRPRFAIQADALLQAMFVHPGRNHYFFGDYYEPRYATLGYRPWYDFRAGNRFASPMFSYYRWEHRDNPRWEQGLRSDFTARRDGTMARPPRTLAGKTEKGLNLLTPIHEWKGPDHKLEPVSKTHIQQAQEHVNQVRNLEQHRSQTEAHSVVKGAPGNLNKAQQIELPKRTIQAPVIVRTPPPAPPAPRVAPNIQPKAPVGPRGSKGGDPHH